MKVSELLDKVDVGGVTRSMVRTALRGFAPGVLDAEISLKIDADAGRVGLSLDGKTVLDASFEECESYVSLPAA